MSGKKSKGKGKKGGKKRRPAPPGSAPAGRCEAAAAFKVKKKCCRSAPRCKRCPVVYHRLVKTGAFELEGKAWKKVVKEARRW